MESKNSENNILKQFNDNLDLNKLKPLLECLETSLQATEAIAELAKQENHRQSLTNPTIIAKLLDLLKDSNIDQVALTIRALANICYENDIAANMITDTNIDNIVELFKNPLNLESKALISNVSVLLINLLHGNDELPKIVLKKHDILHTIEDLFHNCLKDPKTHESLLEFLLSIVNGLTEYLEETQTTFSDSLLSLVVEILRHNMYSTNVCSLCLDILQGVSDLQEENKSILAKSGACEVLYLIIEKKRKIVGEEIYKQACDILVVILTDDSSMDLLYDNGKGQTYMNMIAWLDSQDMELLSTGILAIGNFARKDSNCIEMVQNGVSKKLITLLKTYNSHTDLGDVKIQHAILSTLKNLAIPKENKSQIIKENAIDTLYPLMNQERPVIIFKLLGTFRMLIDGQEKVSMDLLSRKDFVEKLGYWCYNSDHIGVRGEIPRIFSWLIKNCHSSKHFPTLLDHPDSIKCIVEMISSNHAIMQNEAYFALLMLAKGIEESHSKDLLDKLFEIIVDTPIGKHMNFAVNTYGTKWDEHTTKNHLSLVKYLIHSEKVVNNLQEFDYFRSLVTLESEKSTDIGKEVQTILSEVKI